MANLENINDIKNIKNLREKTKTINKKPKKKYIYKNFIIYFRWINWIIRNSSYYS